MANYAKIGLNNIVLEVQFINNKECMNDEGEFIDQIGIDKLVELTGHAAWVRCSFNTSGNIWYPSKDGESINSKAPFRLNYPKDEWYYDATLDGFIQPAIPNLPTWVLNETTGLREAPVPYPTDGERYKWNNDTLQWDQLDSDEYYV